jgi:hypothetical protein
MNSIEDIKSKAESYLFSMDATQKREIIGLLDYAYALGNAIGVKDTATAMEEGKRSGWSEAYHNGIDRCLDIIENEPLGYKTEDEHMKLERFSDSVVAKMSLLKAEV